MILPAPMASAAAVEAPRLLRLLRIAWIFAAVLGFLALAALVLATRADRRVRSVEQELVLRQQDSGAKAAEAQLVAKQAQDAARDAGAKVALLEARVAEVAAQRSRLEELMQSLSRSREDNVLLEVESMVRGAVQQAAVTGRVEPVVAALKQADERLGRQSQPRFEKVRRAIARDLDRIKSASIADVATLTIQLDEAARMIDELPLLSDAMSSRGSSATPGETEPRRDGLAMSAKGFPPGSSSTFPPRPLGAASGVTGSRVIASSPTPGRVGFGRHPGGIG
jgi:uroporphyrin-3 C-methyltransferase